MHQKYKIILASSSPFRRDLLQRLGLKFTTLSPAIDESPQDNEKPADLVVRLATLKAEKAAKSSPDSLIIGSDQIACLDQVILGKPVHHDTAVQQLRQMRGQMVNFLTGLCVLNAQQGVNKSAVVGFQVCFRDYSDAEIERYLLADKPYRCAGSFKSENLGIALVQSMAGPDPTALVGLPLIKLSEFLREFGLKIP